MTGSIQAELTPEMMARKRRRMKLVDKLSSMQRELRSVARSEDLLPTERTEVERTADQVDDAVSLIFRATR